MTWWTIVNPAAGSRERVERRVHAALEERSIPAEVVASESPEHLRSLVEEGISGGAERYLAVGGDGTVSLMADALPQHRWNEPPVIGVLPAGSGCDLIRSVGMPQSLEEAAAHLEGDATYSIDVGVAEGEWGTRRFLNVLDVGVIAGTVRAAERITRRLGKLRYKAAFWLTLPFFRAARLDLTMDRQSFQGKALAVAVANGQYFGFGMNIAPKAALGDGFLEVQAFSCWKWAALSLFPRVKRGSHLSHRAVRRYRSTSVTIETDRPWPIEVDGDYLGETPVTVRIEPGVLRFKI
jgi:diacylglycerol kinase (ATP)